MPAPSNDSEAPSSDRPDRPPSANGVTIDTAALRSPDSPATDEAAPIDPNNPLKPSSDPPRREVLNAMRVLREMPPFAREREIERGRYSHFSAEERELLRNVEK